MVFSNIANAPPFEGFNVGSAGRGITLNNTVLRIHKCTITDVTTNGTSALKLSESSLNNLTSNGSSSEVWKTTLSGAISQTAGTLHTTSVTIAGNFETSTTAEKTVA